MANQTEDAEEVMHALWLIYRNAVKQHIDRSAGEHPFESEAQYRERAEKAGVMAVANFVGTAFQTEAR